VIRRPPKFRSAATRSILVMVAVTHAAVDMENGMAVFPLSRGVLMVVMLLMEPVATVFVGAKEIAARFVLTKVILTDSTWTRSS
jgi:hypothetical protein